MNVVIYLILTHGHDSVHGSVDESLTSVVAGKEC